MRDCPFKEDAEDVTEGKNITSHFEWEVSKHSVGFSESQMSTSLESTQIHESDSFSISSKEQKEEGATALLESKEELRCEKGFCSNMEKEAEDSKQAEVEISVIPVSPPLYLHEQEEEACVEETKCICEPLRKLNGEYYNPNVDHEFPALIRCFQVVNVNTEYLLQTPVLHFLSHFANTGASIALHIHEEGLRFDVLE